MCTQYNMTTFGLEKSTMKLLQCNSLCMCTKYYRNTHYVEMGTAGADIKRSGSSRVLTDILQCIFGEYSVILICMLHEGTDLPCHTDEVYSVTSRGCFSAGQWAASWLSCWPISPCCLAARRYNRWTSSSSCWERPTRTFGL